MIFVVFLSHKSSFDRDWHFIYPYNRELHFNELPGDSCSNFETTAQNSH
ncbi:protein of unknown function [Pseudodesulfovibrio piezophilus C1TLV30]|uniref:Uncharacterized protein n=1 Tax=Pseudodesulfovibrio piezophilus (strain DSM 21447 / JCM 15486 / C1TLV30) TaxID=1322246 RepID=M1WMG3_PSEP2|nr:protein of unknown function [Pseudodesulfovibrio piezophilus C1TLV30]